MPSGRRIDLFIPGLFGPAHDPAADDGRLTAPHTPALTLVCARARRMLIAAADAQTRLFGLFGISPPADADAPVAALTRLADGGTPNTDWWLRADPVCLQPSRDGLVLAAGEGLNISLDEAEALAAEILKVFGEDGWQLEPRHPLRWYLRPRRAALIRTHALDQVDGRDIRHFLPSGPEAGGWRAALTELQLLLHGSTINAAREARGKLPINSLWFWGGGCLPEPGPAPWTGVWSDQALAAGLGCLHGIPTAGVPGNARSWLAAAGPGDHLVTLDGPGRAAQHLDYAGWGGLLEQLDTLWIAPLLAALRAGDLQSLYLHTEGVSFALPRAGLRRLWRWRRALRSYRP